jgi:hypothetical protein
MEGVGQLSGNAGRFAYSKDAGWVRMRILSQRVAEHNNEMVYQQIQ